MGRFTTWALVSPDQADTCLRMGRSRSLSPFPPGTNEWRVLVEAWEVGRPYWSYSLGWRGKVASGLKDLGIYDADPKSYHITSPDFSRPSS